MSSWFTVEKIDNDTYAISEYGHYEKFHSYLLIGRQRAALIDTGLGVGDIGKVVSDITSLPVIVITTHCHWDHICGHWHFADIAVHQAESEWLENGTPFLLEEFREMLLRKSFETQPPASFSMDTWQPFKGKATRLLKDGDRIDLGGRALEILHTPGHSPGHICIFDHSRGYLATGDLIYRGTLFAWFESTNPAAYYKSVARIAALDGVTKLLPSHNSLQIDLDYPQKVLEAFEMLQKKNLLHHGSGLHKFGKVRIRL